MVKGEGFLARSRWWRFDEYEVVGGTHVAPAEGASLEEYDPFEFYRSSWAGKKRKGEEPPYVELAQLADAGPEEWLDWCSKYGLLGMFHEQTLEVRFHPYWREVEEEESNGEAALVPEQVRWQQRGTGRSFRSRVSPEEYQTNRFSRALAEAGMPVAESDVADLEEYTPWIGRGITKPGVTVAGRGGAIQETGVTEGYGKFFPRHEGVSEWLERHQEELLMGNYASPPPRSLEAQQYPLPGTEEFHRQYGEPVVLLRSRALNVLMMLEFWEQAESAKSLDDVIGSSNGEHEQAYRRFRAGLASVQPSAEPVEEGAGLAWDWQWRARSLYGLLHVMMLEDFALKKRGMKRCAKCKSLFVTDNARQKYCSDRCQKAAQQARYRRRKRG